MKIWNAVLICVLCSPSAATPQDREPTTADPIEAAVGKRVRVTLGATSWRPDCGGSGGKATSARVLTGMLAAYDGKEITLTMPECDRPLLVPRGSMERLRVANGRRSAFRRGAVIGATIGLSLGTAVALTCSKRDGYCDDFLPNTGRHEMMFYPTVVLGAAGALLAAPFRVERWQDAALGRAQVHVTPVPRGVAVSLTIPFSSRRPAR